MNVSLETKKQEALKRLHALAGLYELGPKLENYFSQDKLYYSYGYSMDTIHYDPTYAEAVKEFEAHFNALVYHAVEANTAYGRMLSLLYVSDHENEWFMEQPEPDRIMSYTYITEQGWFDGEFGDILLASPMGYLMRIG